MLMSSSPLAKHDNDIGSLRRVEIFLDVVSNRAGSVGRKIQLKNRWREKVRQSADQFRYKIDSVH